MNGRTRMREKWTEEVEREKNEQNTDRKRKKNRNREKSMEEIEREKLTEWIEREKNENCRMKIFKTSWKILITQIAKKVHQHMHIYWL